MQQRTGLGDLPPMMLQGTWLSPLPPSSVVAASQPHTSPVPPPPRPVRGPGSRAESNGLENIPESVSRLLPGLPAGWEVGRLDPLAWLLEAPS